jgi:hypothetical protein
MKHSWQLWIKTDVENFTDSSRPNFFYRIDRCRRCQLMRFTDLEKECIYSMEFLGEIFNEELDCNEVMMRKSLR